MSILASDSPFPLPRRCRWSWCEAHLHRRGAGLGIHSLASWPEGSLGHGHPLSLRLEVRKGRRTLPYHHRPTFWVCCPWTLLLHSSRKGNWLERQRGAGSTGEQPPFLPLHQQPAPHTHAVSTHVHLGCMEKQSTSFPIISGTGRQVPR